MFMRMVYDDKLAQAAYLIGCQKTGEAIVIDPERDVDRYIAEQKLKIEVYRRLSQMNSLEALEELQEELRDRFGPVPAPARRMFRLRELNLRALAWKIENIHLEDGYAVLRYQDSKLIRMLSFFHDGHLRIVDHHDAYWPLECDEEDGAAVLNELLKALSEAEPPIPSDDAARPHDITSAHTESPA